MEVLLAKTLWSKGVRYRKNNRSIYGIPDLSIKKYKIAVFVDSEFFHGKNWEEEKYRIKSNRDFWWPKIERNIRRDQEVNQFLIERGWKVLRFWSKDLHKNTNICVDEIVAVVNQQKSLEKDT
jgi:DNA mismatch endonuclease (patch repair protein)